MPKFRSKSREIEAWQVLAPVTTETDASVPEWVREAESDGTILFTDETTGDGSIVNVIHGSDISFKDTDWIIFNGPEDIYPCTDEEFQKRYEEI